MYIKGRHSYFFICEITVSSSARQLHWKSLQLFFYVGSPKESIFCHLLWSIFQSSLHIYYKLQIMLDCLCGQLFMCCNMSQNMSSFELHILTIFDAVIQTITRQNQWYNFWPDRPTGTLRVNYQSFSHLLLAFRLRALSLSLSKPLKKTLNLDIAICLLNTICLIHQFCSLLLGSVVSVRYVTI